MPSEKIKLKNKPFSVKKRLILNDNFKMNEEISQLIKWARFHLNKLSFYRNYKLLKN